MKNTISIIGAVSILSGCVSFAPLGYGPQPTRLTYSEPEQSGLIAVRPFPGPDDVCQVIGENQLTSPFLDDSAILIGCPKHEEVAIANRVAGGGQVVAHAKHWSLLSMPQR